MKEKLQQKEPSSFVLIQGNKEKRIGIAEKISLDSEPDNLDSHEQVVSFSISSQKNYLNLHIDFKIGFLDPQWGLIKTKFGSEQTNFGTTILDHALKENNGQFFIEGSKVHFDKEKLHLYGKDWAIEYRPL